MQSSADWISTVNALFCSLDKLVMSVFCRLDLNYGYAVFCQLDLSWLCCIIQAGFKCVMLHSTDWI